MRQRLISAAILVPVVVIVFLLGDPWLTLGIAALAGLAAYETSHLVRRAGLDATSSLAIVAAVLAVGVTRMALGPIDFLIYRLEPPPTALLVAVVLSLVAMAFVLAGFIALRRPEPADGFRSWAGNVFSMLYPSLLAFVSGILVVGPPTRPSSPLGSLFDDGRVWLLILVLTVWSFDTLAYVAGKYHGKGRFMNHISPNKTWSGVFGGTIAAIAVCTALVWATGQHPLGGLVLGLVIAVTAQAGDLAESVLKRAAGAKDSGRLLPGHGGILDRVDSFLFAAPAMFITLTFIDALRTMTMPVVQLV